jgi:enoyl-CoA hydratase/carnithine racemase
MTLEYDVSNGVGTITLNRPEQKNAFTFEMIAAWARVVDEAAGDPQVGALILTGAGNSFCSGIDLAELRGVSDTPLAHKSMLTNQIHRVMEAVERLDKPIIAAINGPAVGAGLDMALMCDMRLAGRSARMSEGYIRVGLVPGDGGCYFLPRLVGSAKALELLLTGDFVDADEALRIGMVNRVCEDADLAAEAHGLAEKLAAGPRVINGMIKRAVRHAFHGDLRANMDLISSQMAIAMSTHDSREALAAFLERRAPHFRDHLSS